MKPSLDPLLWLARPAMPTDGARAARDARVDAWAQAVGEIEIAGGGRRAHRDRSDRPDGEPPDATGDPARLPDPTEPEGLPGETAGRPRPAVGTPDPPVPSDPRPPAAGGIVVAPAIPSKPPARTVQPVPSAPSGPDRPVPAVGNPIATDASARPLPSLPGTGGIPTGPPAAGDGVPSGTAEPSARPGGSVSATTITPTPDRSPAPSGPVPGTAPALDGRAATEVPERRAVPVPSTPTAGPRPAEPTPRPAPGSGSEPAALDAPRPRGSATIEARPATPDGERAWPPADGRRPEAPARPAPPAPAEPTTPLAEATRSDRSDRFGLETPTPPREIAPPTVRDGEAAGATSRPGPPPETPPPPTRTIEPSSTPADAPRDARAPRTSDGARAESRETDGIRPIARGNRDADVTIDLVRRRIDVARPDRPRSDGGDRFDRDGRTRPTFAETFADDDRHGEPADRNGAVPGVDRAAAFAEAYRRVAELGPQRAGATSATGGDGGGISPVGSWTPSGAVTGATAGSAPSASAVPSVPIARLAENVATRARAIGDGGTLRVRFALEPDDLGLVRIQIDTRGDTARIRLAATHEHALTVLHARIQEMTAQLHQAGFRHADVQVGLEAHGGPGAWSSMRGGADHDASGGARTRRGASPRGIAAAASADGGTAPAGPARHDRGRLDRVA